MKSIIYHRGSLVTALRNAHIVQKWRCLSTYQRGCRENHAGIAHTRAATALVCAIPAQFSLQSHWYVQFFLNDSNYSLLPTKIGSSLRLYYASDSQ